jgi:phage host-nuclease inhibitor protein Gam
LLKAALEAVAVEKIQTATCSVWLQESASVEVKDEVTFIEQHGSTEAVRTKHAINKEYLLHALDVGEFYEGAKLVTTKHLRIR